MNQTSEDSYSKRLQSLIGNESFANQNKPNVQLDIQCVKDIINIIKQRNGNSAIHNNNNQQQNVYIKNNTTTNTINNNKNKEEQDFNNLMNIFINKNYTKLFEIYQLQQSEDKNHKMMINGLVFLGNLMLNNNFKLGQQLYPIVQYLVNFYTSVEGGPEAEYTILALLTQILQANKEQIFEKSKNQQNLLVKNSHQQQQQVADHDSDSTCVSLNIPYSQQQQLQTTTNLFEWVESRSFICKIFAIDIEDDYPENGKKQKEVLKMLSIVSDFVGKCTEFLKQNRLMNQYKIFLLKNIFYSQEISSLNRFTAKLFYNLCQICNSVKFTEKEILKYRTIEIMIEQIDNVNKNPIALKSGFQQLLFISSFKFLRYLWKQNIRQTAFIKQHLVEKLLLSSKIQPQLVFGFVEEIYRSSSQMIVQNNPQFFRNLLNNFYKQSASFQSESTQILQRILKVTLEINNQELTNSLEMNIKSFIQDMFLQHKKVTQQHMLMAQVLQVIQNQKSMKSEQNQSVQQKNINQYQVAYSSFQGSLI